MNNIIAWLNLSGRRLLVELLTDLDIDINFQNGKFILSIEGQPRCSIVPNLRRGSIQANYVDKNDETTFIRQDGQMISSEDGLIGDVRKVIIKEIPHSKAGSVFALNFVTLA